MQNYVLTQKHKDIISRIFGEPFDILNQRSTVSLASMLVSKYPMVSLMYDIPTIAIAMKGIVGVHTPTVVSVSTVVIADRLRTSLVNGTHPILARSFA